MKPIYYRGWTIQVEVVVQVGHKRPLSRNPLDAAGIGTRRNVRVYVLKGPDGSERNMDTMKEAKEYVDRRLE